MLQRFRTSDIHPGVPWRWLMILPLLVAIAVGSGSNAAGRWPDPETLCDRVAADASRRTGVPFDVLRAITRTETGRASPEGTTPWPWTVNMEGKGVWFDTQQAALDYAERHHDRGARSFDVGCFQLNYRWHGSAFASIRDMFDPVKNAHYAARFLRRLHAETGDWTMAAGAYHSRTERYARKYRARFVRFHRALTGSNSRAEHHLAGPVQDRNARGYPLLVGSARPARLGSLVPVRETASRAFLDTRSAGSSLFPTARDGS